MLRIGSLAALPLTLVALLPVAGARVPEQLPWLAAGLTAGVVVSLVWRRRTLADGEPDAPARSAPVATPQGPLADDAQHRALIEASPTALAVFDRQGRLLFGNGRWMRALGIAAADAPGDGWRRVLDPADRPRVDEKWALKVAFGEPCVDEFRVRRASGETAWLACQSAPVKGPDGVPAGHIVMLEEITARRETGLRLLRLEEQLHLLEEALSLACFEWDLERNRVTWSPRLHAMLSAAEREADPSPLVLARLAHPDDREVLQRAITRQLAGHDALRARVRFQGAAGAFEPFLVCGTMTRDRRGRPTRMTVAIVALPDAA